MSVTLFRLFFIHGTIALASSPLSCARFPGFWALLPALWVDEQRGRRYRIYVVSERMLWCWLSLQRWQDFALNIRPYDHSKRFHLFLRRMNAHG